MDSQWVTFILGKESYGLDISAVNSIIKIQPITAVPHAPEFITGVTNLRGAILPIIDLRARFGLPCAEYTRNTRIIVVGVDDFQVGMIVDGVSEVKVISDQQIEPLPSQVLSVSSNFIRSLANLESGVVILLDLRRVLTVGRDELRESISAEPAVIQYEAPVNV
jgi:purine-binding chemotaxis protein CheW